MRGLICNSYWVVFITLSVLGLTGCNSESGGTTSDDGGTASLPTVDTMPCNGGICTLNSGVVVGDAEARVVVANLAQGNVILKTQNSEVLTLLSPIQWSSHRSLTLQADNDIELFGGISASQGKLIIDNPGHDYHLRKPVDLSAGQNFRVNGDEYTVITSLGQPGSTTGTDLQGISGNLNNNYALGSNIDASTTSSWNSGEGFSPIGNADDSDTTFSGSLNGLGHVIRNIHIDRSEDNYVGLFSGMIDASLIHLALENIQVQGYSSVGSFAGSIEDSKVTQVCVIGGTITAFSDNAAGLVGSSYGDSVIVDSCILGTAIYADHSVGGMVGYNNHNLTVEDSYAFHLNLTDEDGASEIGFITARDEIAAPTVINSLVHRISSTPTNPNNDSGRTPLTGSELGNLSTYQNVSWDISTDPESNSLWYLDKTYARKVPAMLRIFEFDLTDYLHDD
ncbi:hypothetical protein ABMA57_01690 [Saccharospirillum sp. HFRX-1]|uniref:hypothetical protein n=1 Tax=unclassified Saccharospirillum TaxID=2633430 RepID=UPI003723BFD8